MTIRTVYNMSAGPFIFDDADTYAVVGEAGYGDNQEALWTDGQLHVEESASEADHVVRFGDLSATALQPTAVADIDNPTELGSYSGGAVGEPRLAYEIGANADAFTLYLWDSAVGSGANSPYIVSGSSGFWIAGAGRYVSGDHTFHVLSSTETLDEYFVETAQDGVLEAFVGSDDGGLNFSWGAGLVYVDGQVISVDAGNTTVTDDTRTLLYATVAGGSTMQEATTEPGVRHALAFTIDAVGGDLEQVFEEPLVPALLDDVHDASGVLHAHIVSTGLVVADDTDGTNPNDFTIGAGTWYLDGHHPQVLASTFYSAGVGHGDNNLKRYFHTASADATEMSNGVDFGFWDNGANKTAVGAAKWYVAWIFSEAGGDFDYVYPQTEHSNEASALDEVTPVSPPNHSAFVTVLARFVFRGSASAFGIRAFFVDIRPTHAGASNLSVALQNIWETLTGDSGSISANTTADTFNFAGGTHITTAVSGDEVTTEVSGTLVDASNADALHVHANAGITLNVAELDDTSATGTELNSLTDNSMVDGLHRHSELSASDGSPDQVLKIDGTGNVLWNDAGVDVDFTIESTGQAAMFHLDAGTDSVNIKGATPSAGTPLNIAGITQSTSFLSSLYSSNANNAFRTGSGGNLTLDVGGDLLVRDRDSSFVTVFSIASATGDMRCYGNFTGDGSGTLEDGLTVGVAASGANLHSRGQTVTNATALVNCTLEYNGCLVQNSSIGVTGTFLLALPWLAQGDIIYGYAFTSTPAGGTGGVGTVTVELYKHAAATAADVAPSQIGTGSYATGGTGIPSRNKVAFSHTLASTHTVDARDAYCFKVTLDNQYDVFGTVGIFNISLFLELRNF